MALNKHCSPPPPYFTDVETRLRGVTGPAQKVRGGGAGLWILDLAGWLRAPLLVKGQRVCGCLASAHLQEEEVHGCDDVGVPLLPHPDSQTSRLTFPATCPAALDRAAGGMFLRHLSEELLACRDHPGVGFQGVHLLQ